MSSSDLQVVKCYMTIFFKKLSLVFGLTNFSFYLREPENP